MQWFDFRNPGILKASEAAQAIGGSVIVPDFGLDRPEKATDFNDMLAHRGKDAVTRFFINHFLGMGSSAIDYRADDTGDQEQASFVCQPSEQPIEIVSGTINVQGNKTSQSSHGTRHSDTQPNVPSSEPAQKPKAHFSPEEFETVDRIWRIVPRKVSRHSETGYALIVDDLRKVTVTRNRIDFAQKPKHRMDAAYVASCEHARQFWNGQMEVHGDSQHCVKAWAYASVYGIQITNFTPSSNEMVEANKIIVSLRQKMTPAIHRPTPARTTQSTRPSM